MGILNRPALDLHKKIEFISFGITAHVMKLLLMMIK
jgi:hypothetical protein